MGLGIWNGTFQGSVGSFKCPAVGPNMGENVTHGFGRFFWQKNSEYCKNCRFVRCMFVGPKVAGSKSFGCVKNTQIISRQIIGRVVGEACLKWPYFREIQVGEMLYLATNINTY